MCHNNRESGSRGEMTQRARALTEQAWGLEFNSQNLCEKLGVATRVPVTPALCVVVGGGETEFLLGLAGCFRSIK